MTHYIYIQIVNEPFLNETFQVRGTRHTIPSRGQRCRSLHPLTMPKSIWLSTAFPCLSNYLKCGIRSPIQKSFFLKHVPAFTCTNESVVFFLVICCMMCIMFPHSTPEASTAITRTNNSQFLIFVNLPMNNIVLCEIIYTLIENAFR